MHHSPISREDVLEVERGIDIGGDDVSQDERVLAVQHQGPVQHVEEQMDVAGGREVTRHGFEHARYEPDPPMEVFVIELLRKNES